MVRFGSDYPDIKALTRNAWDIDRNLLVGLDRATWNATVQEVTAAITDGVLAEAVSRMPPEALRPGRAGLGSEAPGASRRASDGRPPLSTTSSFRYADIHGTDTDEVAMIERVDGGDVRIAISPAGAVVGAGGVRPTSSGPSRPGRDSARCASTCTGEATSYGSRAARTCRSRYARWGVGARGRAHQLDRLEGCGFSTTPATAR